MTFAGGAVQDSATEKSLGDELRVLRLQRNRAETQLLTLATAAEATASSLRSLLEQQGTDPATITVELQPPQGAALTMTIAEVLAWVTAAVDGARGVA